MQGKYKNRFFLSNNSQTLYDIIKICLKAYASGGLLEGMQWRGLHVAYMRPAWRTSFNVLVKEIMSKTK